MHANDPRSLLDEAVRHHRSGRLGEAETRYRRVLSANPGHPDGLHLLGVLLTQRGENEEAIVCLKRAVEASTNPPPAFLDALGKTFFRAGRLREARDAFSDLVQREPSSFEGHSDLGIVLQDLGEIEEAVGAHRRAVSLNPRFARAHYNLGTALKTTGDIGGALASVKQAIALEPGAPIYHATLAGYLLELGEIPSALGACDACLSMEPRNLMALTMKAVALDRSGDRPGAMRIVDLDRFIHCQRLSAPAGYGDLKAFHGALTEHVLNHPTLAFEPTNNATRHGRHTGNLLNDSTGPAKALEPLLNGAVADFLNGLPPERDHPYLAHRPGHWKLQAWAVVMDSQGHQLPHTHPDGWVSGVYYLKLPPEVSAGSTRHAGWIEFGRPLAELQGDLEPSVRPVKPEEGLLVLFPSYFYHLTIPFESREQRISIAFDAVPSFA